MHRIINKHQQNSIIIQFFQLSSSNKPLKTKSIRRLPELSQFLRKLSSWSRNAKPIFHFSEIGNKIELFQTPRWVPKLSLIYGWDLLLAAHWFQSFLSYDGLKCLNIETLKVQDLGRITHRIHITCVKQKGSNTTNQPFAYWHQEWDKSIKVPNPNCRLTSTKRQEKHWDTSNEIFITFGAKKIHFWSIY